MRVTGYTPAEACRQVYKGLAKGYYRAARLEINTRTIYVKQGKQHRGILVPTELYRALWVDSGGDFTAAREQMEEVTGPNSAQWSIKILG